jgi:hypothetical protein
MTEQLAMSFEPAPKMPEPRPGQQMYYDTLLQFFEHKTPSPNVLAELTAIRAPFLSMAEWLLRILPANPERTICIRSLLTAQEAAIRARLFK